jgi:HAD superfamily hydrolase (TIGR01450 family)
MDVDGVIKRGSELIEGTVEAIETLRRKSVPFLLITNNSTKTPASLSHQFESKGLGVEAKEIMTSSQALTHLLDRQPKMQQRARRGVYVLGEEGLLSELTHLGYPLVDKQTDGLLAVGLDRGFDYKKLVCAMRSIQLGAVFLATNTDKTYPAEEAEMPGAGSIVASIVACTNKKPIVVGKPSRTFFRAAMTRFNASLDPKDVLVVGDRPETDIVMANRNGCASVLVLSGVTKEIDPIKLREFERPTFVFTNLYEAVKSLIAD